MIANVAAQVFGAPLEDQGPCWVDAGGPIKPAATAATCQLPLSSVAGLHRWTHMKLETPADVDQFALGNLLSFGQWPEFPSACQTYNIRATRNMCATEGICPATRTGSIRTAV